MNDRAEAGGEPASEESQNRLLRQVDWRFLLPSARPPRTAVHGARAGTASVLTRFAVEVSPLASGAPAEADLAVGNGRRELPALRRALAPGGACLAEWRTPPAGGAWAVRRRLERAGFDEIACYWPWPAPGRELPRFWLPLDSPAAAAYLLESRPPAAPGLEESARAVRDAVWRAQSAAGLLAPLLGMGFAPRAREEPGGADDPGGLAALAARALGLSRREPLSWLLLTRGERSINKVIALAFLGIDPRPLLVVKIARRAESDPALAREAAALDALDALAPQFGRAPRALALAQVGGRAALAESFDDGVSLAALLSEETFREHVRSASELLTTLVGAGSRQPAGWRERLVAAPLEAFRRRFGSVADPADLRTTEQQLALLPELPPAFEHRDFAPWNLASGGGGLIAYDWESSEPRGLPVTDLVYFLVFAAFFLDGALESGRLEQSYDRVFDLRSALGLPAAEALELYLRRTGLQPEVVQPLRLLTWIIHAPAEYERLYADGPRSQGRTGSGKRSSSGSGVRRLVAVARSKGSLKACATMACLPSPSRAATFSALAQR